MTNRSLEEPNRSSEGRNRKLEMAADILDRLFRDGKVEEKPGKMIVIDVASGLYVVGIGSDSAQHLLRQREMSGLPANEESRNQFASLPLEKTRLNAFLAHMGIARAKVEETLDPEAEKK